MVAREASGAQGGEVMWRSCSGRDPQVISRVTYGGSLVPKMEGS